MGPANYRFHCTLYTRKKQTKTYKKLFTVPQTNTAVHFRSYLCFKKAWYKTFSCKIDLSRIPLQPERGWGTYSYSYFCPPWLRLVAIVGLPERFIEFDLYKSWHKHNSFSRDRQIQKVIHSKTFLRLVTQSFFVSYNLSFCHAIFLFHRAILWKMRNEPEERLLA